MAEQAGIFTKFISEAEIRNLYELNQDILSHSLGTAPVSVPALTKQLYMDSHKGYFPSSPASSLVRITDDLFLHIACKSENHETVHFVHSINNRLHHVRICECQTFKNATDELLDLCQLYYRAHYEALIQGLKDYHSRRTAFTPWLMQML